MIYLCSTTVIPSGAYGAWHVEPCELQGVEASLGMADCYTSAIGHQSTADIMSELLGITVEMNRITVHPEPGDVFICFRLNTRPPEGAILDRQTLETVGYGFVLMRYLG